MQMVASQAMDYLDSVGVAADYKITTDLLTVVTDDGVFNLKSNGCKFEFLWQIISAYSKEEENRKRYILTVRSKT